MRVGARGVQVPNCTGVGIAYFMELKLLVTPECGVKRDIRITSAGKESGNTSGIIRPQNSSEYFRGL